MKEMKEMTSAIRDLINRLEDAEKGFLEIKKSISNPILREWMSKYANERNLFQMKLNGILNEFNLNQKPETSFLGDMHRMFIDFKLNNLSDDYDSIINEIERGSKVLIKDYEKVIDEIKMPINIKSSLQNQKGRIEQELKDLMKLKAEMTVSAVL